MLRSRTRSAPSSMQRALRCVFSRSIATSLIRSCRATGVADITGLGSVRLGSGQFDVRDGPCDGSLFHHWDPNSVRSHRDTALLPLGSVEALVMRELQPRPSQSAGQKQGMFWNGVFLGF